MGNFRKVILVLVSDLRYGWCDLTQGDRVTSELVGDDLPWGAALPLEQFPEET
jgi:hypothetical protein